MYSSFVHCSVFVFVCSINSILFICITYLLFLYQDYLFDSKQLTDGAPPNDRGCRFCGKIGHIQKDCPKRKLNMERKEKNNRQRDRREMRKLGCALPEERDGEEQKHLTEEEGTQESENIRGKEAGGGDTVGDKLQAKATEGIKLTIPVNMMKDHCDKWERDQDYRMKGDKLLGMRRYSVNSFDFCKVSEETLVCHSLLPERDEQYLWTVNRNKAAQVIGDGLDSSANPFSSVYNFILKTLEIHMHQIQETDHIEGLIVPSIGMPDNIGQTLQEKMKEVIMIRKQKKKERMKVRYRREMAGPGYKRGKKFEMESKRLNSLDNKGKGHLESMVPVGAQAAQENSNKNYFTIPKHQTQKTKTRIFTRPNPASLPVVCSSSEEETLAQRTVRRKNKHKDHQGSLAHSGQKSKSAQGVVGGMKPGYMVKEFAIKAKHRPYLGMTHKLVPVGPEKEIVTLSISSATCSQDEIGRSASSLGEQSVPRTQGHTEQKAYERSSILADRFDSEGPEISRTDGANEQKKKRKPRPKRRKRKGLKSEHEQNKTVGTVVE